MLDKLIIWAVQNRLLVVLTLIASIGAGLFLIPQLNLDAFPDVTNIQVTVCLLYTSDAADECPAV